MKILCFLCLLLGACSHIPTTQLQPKLVVSIKEQKMQVVDEKTKRIVKEVPVETSRKGVGFRIRSNKTPTGNYYVVKETGHRFGPVLRLSGYQGYKRGILIHRDFKNGNGTSGCICPINLDYMNEVYNLVGDTTPLEIKL